MVSLANFFTRLACLFPLPPTPFHSNGNALDTKRINTPISCGGIPRLRTHLSPLPRIQSLQTGEEGVGGEGGGGEEGTLSQSKAPPFKSDVSQNIVLYAALLPRILPQE